MAGGVIRARLRKGKDDDIAAALEAALATKDEADIIREALRVYFDLYGVEVPTARAKVQPTHKHAPGTRTGRQEPISKPPDLVQHTETKTANADDALDGLLGF